MHWNHQYSFPTGFSVSISAAPPSPLLTLLHNWCAPGMSRTQSQYSLLPPDPLGLPLVFWEEMRWTATPLHSWRGYFMLSFSLPCPFAVWFYGPWTCNIVPSPWSCYMLHTQPFLHSLQCLLQPLLPDPHPGPTLGHTHTHPNTSIIGTNTISVTHTYFPRKQWFRSPRWQVFTSLPRNPCIMSSIPPPPQWIGIVAKGLCLLQGPVNNQKTGT